MRKEILYFGFIMIMLVVEDFIVVWSMDFVFFFVVCIFGNV